MKILFILSLFLLISCEEQNGEGQTIGSNDITPDTIADLVEEGLLDDDGEIVVNGQDFNSLSDYYDYLNLDDYESKNFETECTIKNGYEFKRQITFSNQIISGQKYESIQVTDYYFAPKTSNPLDEECDLGRSKVFFVTSWAALNDASFTYNQIAMQINDGNEYCGLTGSNDGWGYIDMTNVSDCEFDNSDIDYIINLSDDGDLTINGERLL